MYLVAFIRRISSRRFRDISRGACEANVDLAANGGYAGMTVAIYGASYDKQSAAGSGC